MGNFKNLTHFIEFMLLFKKGFPQDEELVLCTVTSVQIHSVFVTLDEYGNRTGMIHISEVAPGRIKNMRDFVQEGKKVICKVLNINQEKGHIDLSLRRVNEKQKQQKNNEIKQEQFAETIITHFTKQTGKDMKELYKLISEKSAQKYPTIYSLFEVVSFNNASLSDIGISKEISEPLNEFIRQRIKPPEVELEGQFTLSSYASNGVDLIKEAFSKISTAKNKTRISYSGGGIYRVIVKSEDYKSAEKNLQKISSTVLEFAKLNKMTAEFKRVENE